MFEQRQRALAFRFGEHVVGGSDDGLPNHQRKVFAADAELRREFFERHRLERTAEELTLVLEPEVADLGGEAVEKRLAALGESLGCQPTLAVVEPEPA